VERLPHLFFVVYGESEVAKFENVTGNRETYMETSLGVEQMNISEKKIKEKLNKGEMRMISIDECWQYLRKELLGNME